MTAAQYRAVILLTVVSVFLLTACDWRGSSNRTARSTGLKSIGNGQNLQLDGTALPPQFAGSKGIVSKNLFAEQLSDDTDRIDRLEEAVQNLQNELDSVMPSIKNLTAIEKDIQELVEQLKTVVDETPTSTSKSFVLPVDPVAANNTAATMQSQQLTQNDLQPALQVPSMVKTPAPVSNTPAKPAPIAQNASGKTITNVRAADYPNKVRAVFESPVKINYTTNYDPAEQILILTMDASRINADLQAVARKSKYITSIQKVAKNANATELVLSFSGVKSFKPGGAIPPNADNASYRYYFDIMK